MKKNIFFALLLTSITATAQKTITFDTDDYRNISVYDSWENSPFRSVEGQSPRLEGNVAVVTNHLNQIDEVLGKAPNKSSKILAFQRSRYGSNQFGVRVDLKSPFRLTKESQFVHVMIHKPVESRVMIIGLGKRTEEAWNWQDGETEQFKAITTLPAAADCWVDAVVQFNGFSYADPDKDGIDIYSLVIVPDVRSTHADESDFACYIDEIVINNNPEPRFYSEKYAVSFDRERPRSRSDRYMQTVGIEGGTFSSQTASLSLERNYYDLTTNTVFSAKAGQTITPTYTYVGNPMHSFTYVDFGNDGRFSVELDANNNYIPTSNSDLCSFQFIHVGGVNYNSKGEHPATSSLMGTPSPEFTLPETMKPGFYRIRFKVDWNETDAAGSRNPSSAILATGGGIVDAILDIHGDKVKVSQGALNGEVIDAEGNHLDNYTTDYGKPFIVKMNPAKGFGYSGIRVKYGYNVSSPHQFDKNDNPYYLIKEISNNDFDENDCYTLPAEIMIGEEVYIEGIFVEKKTSTVQDCITDYPKSIIYDLQGVRHSRLNKGVNIVNRHKILR